MLFFALLILRLVMYPSEAPCGGPLRERLCSAGPQATALAAALCLSCTESAARARHRLTGTALRGKDERAIRSLRCRCR